MSEDQNLTVADSGSDMEPAAPKEENSDTEAKQGTKGMSDDAQLALDGITMLLQNEWGEAEELFKKHKDDSILMCSGYGFVLFMQAIMSFEDDKVKLALKTLQDIEKKCESSTSFLETIKHKVGSKKTEIELKFEYAIQKRIILADSLIYQAVLTFINADIKSLMKGGWLLRKAWKVYDKTYNKIKAMHDSLPVSLSSANLIHAIDGTLEAEEALDAVAQDDQASGPSLMTPTSDGDSITKTSSFDGLSAKLQQSDVERLLASVSFGYGVFQLCISMMPPKLLKVIEFLGFEGDKNVGLRCLEYCCHSKDMKAPLASMGLMWYHTVIRPFFALDGGLVSAGAEDAIAEIERCEDIYPKSALFLFFKGRVYRLQSKIDLSLETYKEALNVGHKKEIEMICYHEIGWVNLMKAEWTDAAECFELLKKESKWSKSFYGYLLAMSVGATGDLKTAESELKQVPNLVMKKKNNQIEEFVLKRVEKFKKTKITQEHCSLRLLEVLYLWNAFPSCQKGDLKRMLEESQKLQDKKLYHLQSFCEAAISNELGETEMAKVYFEESIARQEGKKDDLHVAAYSMYELGIMLMAKPETFLEGKKYMMTAKDKMKDYDFENRLSVRIHAAMKRIKENGSPV